MPDLARRARAAVRYLLGVRNGAELRFRLLPEVMPVVRLSAEKLREEQIVRLGRTLRRAGESVPFWRDSLRRAGIASGDLEGARALEALAALPVLTREDIRAHGAGMLSERYRVDRLRLRKTGGSTGEPLRFYKSAEDSERQLAIQLRSFRLLGFRLGDPLARIWGYGRNPAGNWIWPLAGQRFFDAFRMADDDLRRWARALRALRPRLLYGYTSAIDHLAEFYQREGLAPPPGLDMIVTTSEKLYPFQRERIQAGLGARVFDEYGASEVNFIASECRRGRMHVATDAVFLEFLRDDPDEAVAPRLLVTSLVSDAQPFIRYDIGDRAWPVDGACECGLPFPLIAVDLGKAHLVFRLGSGRRINSVYFFKGIYPIEGIRRLQILHVERDAVEFRLIVDPERREAVARVMDERCREFRGELGDGLRLGVRFVEELERTRAGKTPLVVSRVDEDAA